MGDTGALTLGGVIAGSAILIGNHLLLLLIGGVFVVEALSVILQVAYYKMTRKRILKMSPLHHHYELSGWPERKITTRFWAAAVVLSLVGFAVGR
jgi:phospho-N-acetylmuramoyl-pentapeptide-transferase